MRTVSPESASGANLIEAVHLGPKGTSARPSRRRRILWIFVVGWTVFVGLALWWLLKGNGGISLWVFQERDLDMPGLSEKVQAMFRGELGLQRACPWILFSPYLALLAWHFPLERGRLRGNLPLHAAICLIFIWACYALALRTTVNPPRFMIINPDYPAAPGPAPSEPNPPGAKHPGEPVPGGGGQSQSGERLFRIRRPPGPPRTPDVSLRSTILDLLAYGVVTGLVHSVNFYRRLRERERRALLLESNLAKARLNTLKAQLQPHFLFNSLNAIAALLRRDPRLAEATLVSLSELLRLALRQSERQEGALCDELEFVQRYLEIQQTRFGDKLRVEQAVEPQALDCLVPTPVLQPLVENAIRHGIEPAEKAGTVRVSAFRAGGSLVLTVEDDGVGLAGGALDSSGRENPAGVRPSLPAPPQSSTTRVPSPGTGIGLSNLRERLQALYGDRQKLELTPGATGGVVVRVEIPWHSRAWPGATDSCEV